MAITQTPIGERFLPVRKIGSGGVTTVHLAKDLNNGSFVAIKTLNEGIMEKERGAKIIGNEAGALSRIRHGGVPFLVDASAKLPGPYIAMEHAAGKQLSINALATGRRRLIVELSISLCGILGAIHREGIVHRDVKPANIMYDAANRAPRLLDFGFALVPGMPDLGSDRVVGTPIFMAPEQSYPGYRVDARADIYSLAIIIYSFYSMNYPYIMSDNSNDKAIEAHRFQPSVPLSHFVEGAPPRLAYALGRALEKDPQKRFQDAEEFADALSGCL